jgi:hypothetical protein
MPLNFAMSTMNAGEVSPVGRARFPFLEQRVASPLPGDGLLPALRAVLHANPAACAHELESQPWGQGHVITLGKIYYFGFFATYLASACCCSSSALRSSAPRWRRSPGLPNSPS